ncbi:chemotaxis protein CheW [Brevundimonas sp.]|uniref:chemotaxis protein CheW n=1 Tax=Brevundimonas sp. TaxID=1871086 RepID=UPI0019CCD2CB|nr:chemotaxis protein CheW [Brevundimonas sp.]MBD3837014.1 purine-binding chemotaxis protein CheW [Brevundimonas sp.]
MTNRAPGRREQVGFRVGQQAFCIDIASVIEIRGWTPATPLPGAPAYLKGVLNLRGTVLPIIDLAVRLGLASTEPSARHAILVVRSEAGMAGLLVEGVSDILQLDDADRQPPPSLGGAPGLVSAVFAVDDMLISLLDLERILPRSEKRPDAATSPEVPRARAG